MFRGRRRRNFNKGRYFSSNQDSNSYSDKNDGKFQNSDRPRRERPPPHLRGRDIGMWYARRNRKESTKNMEERLPSLSLDQRQARLIGNTLNKLQPGLPSQRESSHSIERRERDAASSSDYVPLNQFNNDWDNVIVHPVESKFDGLVQDLTLKNFEETKMNIETKETFYEEDDNMEAKEEHMTEFSERLNNIKDSKFKKAYTANLLANQTRTKKGLNALSNDVFEALSEDPLIEQSMYNQMQDKQRSSKYQEMMEFRKKLPSYKMKDEILESIQNNKALVLSGETGCGKTTQVAQFILDDCIAKGKASTCRIICTQPRRISAISVAQRVAAERAEQLGNSVGYQIRLERSLPRKTGSILFCTTGIVLQWLQSDPTLSTVSHLILDEIHERDILSDFLICIVKDLLVLRPDMKVILMSATLNAEQFSQYYGNCPMLHIPGFTFPVKEHYLEDVLELTRYEFPEQKFKRRYESLKAKEQIASFDEFIDPYIRDLQKRDSYSTSTLYQLRNPQSEEMDMDLIVQLLRYIYRQQPGAVLVFLPGWSQISSLHNLILKDAVLSGDKCLVIPLHSLMPTVNQREVFDRPKPGVRKIVLATNIAETSITIDDIVYVIDSGKIKLKNYDKESDVSTLLPEWVALANARQRRGRAGRVQEGVCFHLYTKARQSQFADYQLPELLRTRLEEIILQVKILQLGLCKSFLSKVMEPPEEKVVDTSIQMLRTINALDDSENLTPLGFHLARLPMDPFTGKMLIMGAIFSCLDPILTVAASLSFKDPFIIPIGKESQVDKRKAELDEGRHSDHLMLVTVYNGWIRATRHNRARDYAWQNFLSPSVLEQLKRMRLQFHEMLKENNFIDKLGPTDPELNRNSRNLKLVKAIITAGLYPNVARILNNKWGKAKAIRLPDSTVKLHPKSVNDKVKNFEGSWMVYWEKIKSSKIFLHDTTVVTNYPLLLFGQKLEYDSNRKCINVDRFVKVRCGEDVAQIIQNLRNELDNLLEYKITHPGPTHWDKESKEGLLLSTIVELISSEKTGLHVEEHCH